MSMKKSSAKLEPGLRSVLSFVENMLIKSRVWSFVSFLVGLRTYQHAGTGLLTASEQDPS